MADSAAPSDPAAESLAAAIATETCYDFGSRAELNERLTSTFRRATRLWANLEPRDDARLDHTRELNAVFGRRRRELGLSYPALRSGIRAQVRLGGFRFRVL